MDARSHNSKSPAPDVFRADCGTRQVLDLIADKWTALVVCALMGRTRRYTELKRSINGVSQKMLTQTLRRLERDGLVLRRVYPGVPPAVEYSLTPLGETLHEPLRAICRWAEEHLGEVEASRAQAKQRHSDDERLQKLQAISKV